MKPLERGDLQVRLMMKGHDGSQHSRNLKVSSNPKRNPVYQGELVGRKLIGQVGHMAIVRRGRGFKVPNGVLSLHFGSEIDHPDKREIEAGNMELEGLLRCLDLGGRKALVPALLKLPGKSLPTSNAQIRQTS